MNWKQAKELLDKVASDLIQRFVDSIDTEGPEAIGKQLNNLDLEETAEFFADLKFFDETDYEDESGKIVKFEGISAIPEIKGFADWVKRKYKVDIPEEDDEEFCYEIAKMLTNLGEMKRKLQSDLVE